MRAFRPPYKYLLAKASRGDRKATARLKRLIAVYLTHKDPLPDDLRDYAVAMLLNESREGEEKQSGRPKADAIEIWAIALEVDASGLPLTKQPGGAYYEIGRKYAKSASAVESICERAKSPEIMAAIVAYSRDISDLKNQS